MTKNRRAPTTLLFRFHALPIRRAAKDACRRDPVIPSGFEPETHSLEGCCSIQLSYGTISSSRAQSRTPVRNSAEAPNGRTTPPPSVAAVRANAETKVMKKSKTEIRTTKLFVFTDRTHHRVRPAGRADEPIPPISGGQLADWEILCIFAGFQSPKGSGVIRLLN